MTQRSHDGWGPTLHLRGPHRDAVSGGRARARAPGGGAISALAPTRMAGGRRGLLAIAFVIMWLLSAARSAQGGEELIGLTFGHHTIETILAHKREGRLWLPLEDISGPLSLQPIVGKDKSVTLTTPLGGIAVPPSAILTENATRYLDQRFLETRLNAKSTFDAESGVLTIDLPWSPGARPLLDGTDDDGPDLEAEVKPNDAGIATLHGDAAYTYDAYARNDFEGVFRATGHANGGVWQVTYEEDLLTRHTVRDAIWMKQIDDNRFVQVGHQTLALHPLLEAIEMTGIQYAWTNVPQRRRSAGLNAGTLLDRRVDHERSFAGKGPVGGRAELWLDDRLYASQPISISGAYNFTSIPLPARQIRIEIRIYERRDAKSPIRIEKKTLALSEFLLEQGQFAVTAGGGYGGNVFDEVGNHLRGSHDPHRRYGDNKGAALIGHARYGVNDDLTVEAGVTVTDQVPRVMAGAIAKLFKGTVGSASFSYGEATGVSTLGQFDWRKADWHVIARSYWRERDYRAAFRPSLTPNGRPIYDPDWDHFLEIAYAVRANLTVGVIARHQPEASFALPFVRWQPRQNLAIQARPDQYGIYRFDARYGLSRNAHIYASYHDGDGSVSYVRSFENDLAVTAEVQRNWQNDWRAGARLSQPHLFTYDVSWHLGGYVSDDGDYDIYAGLRRRVRPGVHVYADGHYATYTGGFYRYDDREDLRLRVGVSFDLAMTDGGLAAAPSYGIDRWHGAIAGQVRAPEGSGVTDLSGLTVEIDGRKAATTDADGTFFATNIDAGNRLVTIDGEGLPIELVAKRTGIIAEVAPGAVTRLAFELAAEYGAAGRVVDPAGRAVAGAEVVVEAKGEVISKGQTNAFGYYRVDGLPPGKYRAFVVLEDTQRGPAKEFAISNEFAFDIDLKSR